MQQNRTSPFDIRGTKVLYLLLAVIANLAFALAFFSFVDWLLLNYGEAVTGVDTTLMLGLFMGALLIAFLISFSQRRPRNHLRSFRQLRRACAGARKGLE